MASVQANRPAVQAEAGALTVALAWVLQNCTPGSTMYACLLPKLSAYSMAASSVVFGPSIMAMARSLSAKATSSVATAKVAV
ncbi:hypothetical protein D3C85_1408800 [compost metagenome]